MQKSASGLAYTSEAIILLNQFSLGSKPVT